MSHLLTRLRAALLLPMFLVPTILAIGTGAWAQDHDHHHHDHGAVPEMGEDGKRLDSYQVKHDMDAETIQEESEKITG